MQFRNSVSYTRHWPYKHFYPPAQEESGGKGGCKGGNPARNLGQAANCRAGERFPGAGEPGNWLPAPSCALAACDFAHIWAELDATGAWPAAGNDTVTLELSPGACLRPRRRARLERILRLAALALAIAQDAVDDRRVGNEGNYAHAGATGAEKGIHFENLLQQARPSASGFLGDVGVVRIRLGVRRATGTVAAGGWKVKEVGIRQECALRANEPTIAVLWAPVSRPARCTTLQVWYMLPDPPLLSSV